MVLLITLYKMVLNLKSVDEIPKCDYQAMPTEKYCPVVLFNTLYN